jgi:outer membrane immunogenic protein
VKKFAFAAAALAATAATPAFAQDSGTTVYVGPVVGYDSVTLSDGTDSESTDGVLYGVVAGVDFNLSQGMFVGAEAEFTDSDVGETVSDIDVVGDSASLEAGRSLYVGARVGANVGEMAKVYVKGGYSNAKIEGTYDDTVDVFTVSDELDGWVLGAGAEARFSPVVVRLEYRYADYNEIEFLGAGSGIDMSRHQVVLGALLAF